MYINKNQGQGQQCRPGKVYRVFFGLGPVDELAVLDLSLRLSASSSFALLAGFGFAVVGVVGITCQVTMQ